LPKKLVDDLESLRNRKSTLLEEFNRSLIIGGVSSERSGVVREFESCDPSTLIGTRAKNFCA